ncbi:hypothetical protein [Agrobacterium larrymoorei]|uniref:hypothetical protein n=1 Tax=Agrobacterium larrymoorei TaxID=160699 RepID=UPI0030C652DB
MQYFILAGLGGELFEAVRKVVAKEFRSSPIIGRPVKTNQSYSYSLEDITVIARLARDMLASNIEKGSSCFLSLIYAQHANSEVLLDNFTPATLNFSLPSNINYIEKDQALPLIMRAVRNAQSLGRTLNTIFESEIRRSPLALPFANYKIDTFPTQLTQASTFHHDDDPASIGEIVNLPTALTVSPKTTVFSDNRNLLFVPAKRREFHGHEVSGDLPFTWLRGAFRVGRSLPVGFHYDVRPDKPPLSRFDFEDCEKGLVSPKSEHTYINITPNDRIRLGKKG